MKTNESYFLYLMDLIPKKILINKYILKVNYEINNDEIKIIYKPLNQNISDFILVSGEITDYDSTKNLVIEALRTLIDVRAVVISDDIIEGEIFKGNEGVWDNVEKLSDNRKLLK